MDNSQIQLKLSLSPKLNALLKGKADRLGIPSTQLVKYLIVREVDDEEYPTYRVSERTEKKAEKALRDVSSSKKIHDISTFIEEL